MEEGKDALSRMQDKLYSRTSTEDIHPRQGLSREPLTKGESWPTDPDDQAIETPMVRTPSKMPLKTLFFGSVIFFIVALGVAAYTFIYGGNTVSSSNINMSVLGPSLVDGGKETSFQITIENRNAAELTLVDLIVDYPEGTRSAVNLTQPLSSERISLGTIAPGQSMKQTVRAVLFGSEGSSNTIKATLEYRVQGSNAVFVKEAQADLIIGSSPVSVVVNAPDEAVSGQPISFDVSVRSNSQSPIKNVSVEGQYPFGFSVSEASPEASLGDSLWQLGDLQPGEEKVLKIKGVLEGQDNEERVFRFLAGSVEDKTDAHVAVPYLTVPHSLTIKRPFVTADLALNGDSGKVVSVAPGATISGKISWTNNLDTAIGDLEIDARIEGAALDKASVTPSRGFYRSLDSTIVWSKDEDSSFASIAPGAQGVVEFTFSPKTSVGVNPQIEVTVSVRAKRPSTGNVPEEIVSGFSRTVKVGSALTLSAVSQHFTGPIVTSGPMPPKVDQETTYSITLTAKNPSNTISNAKVSASLPSYMTYRGQVTPGTSAIVYDERTRALSWNIGDLKAGTTQKVSFKVGLTPSLSQVNNRPALMSSATLTGDDRFTGTRITSSVEGPTTDITGEAGFTSGMESVTK